MSSKENSSFPGLFTLAQLDAARSLFLRPPIPSIHSVVDPQLVSGPFSELAASRHSQEPLPGELPPVHSERQVLVRVGAFILVHLITIDLEHLGIRVVGVDQVIKGDTVVVNLAEFIVNSSVMNRDLAVRDRNESDGRSLSSRSHFPDPAQVLFTHDKIAFDVTANWVTVYSLVRQLCEEGPGRLRERRGDVADVPRRVREEFLDGHQRTLDLDAKWFVQRRWVKRVGWFADA